MSTPDRVSPPSATRSSRSGGWRRPKTWPMSSRSCSAPTRATSTATTSSSTAVSAETSSAACRASPRSRADETISLRRADTMGKKLLFVGAGAIGSYLGAFLSRAGHDVTLVDPWADQVETIRERGISVTGPHEPFEARPAAIHVHEAARSEEHTSELQSHSDLVCR